ncbi:hypothetical protein MP213Fo_20990 [Pseudochrobactrum sp. MP213Fo]
MRPAQQNRRMRGRGSNNNNNNNRKGPNPLSRNYESNGPDVKIRGNAQHIAEKYTTLARDAQATGDRVIAENYLQHAEHYNRIILAAQAQNPVPLQREENFDDDNYDDDDVMEQGNSGQLHQVVHQEVYDGSGPQPVIEGTPAEVMYGEENSRTSNRNPRQQNNRPDRSSDRNSDRNQGERNYNERNAGDRNQNDRQQNDRNQNDRQSRMQRPRRHQRPDYNAEQSNETAAVNAAPFDSSSEQPVIHSPVSAPVQAAAPVVTSVLASPAPVSAAPVAIEAPAPVVETQVAEAPVVRRRPRVAAAAVRDADTATAPVAAAAQVDADQDAGSEDTETRRPRRVLRPRRTVRTASADNEAQDQDTALAKTE